MTNTEILSLPMEDNDAGAATIGEYLTKLLLGVWQDREGFSGKRPFGNSGWQHEIYAALTQHGVITGELEEWGELTLSFDAQRQADTIIDGAIQGMCSR